MHKINLRELYPDMYKTDTFLEVTDEVQAVFLSDKRAEAAHERQMYRYKAQYSLDCDNGIEDAVVHRSPTPEEALEDKQLRDQIYTAVMELPGKQLEQYKMLSQDAQHIKEDRQLTAALIDRLINRIEVSREKRITVRFRFQSEFEHCEEVLSQCRNM